MWLLRRIERTCRRSVNLAVLIPLTFLIATSATATDSSPVPIEASVDAKRTQSSELTSKTSQISSDTTSITDCVETSTRPAAINGTENTANIPIIFHKPKHIKSGDYFGLQGNNFGINPTIEWLNSDGTTAQKSHPAVEWEGRWIGIDTPQLPNAAIKLKITRTDGQSSQVISLNGAIVNHLDTLEILPDGHFKIFGLNLIWPGFKPKVCINGLSAEINEKTSDAYVLDVKAPRTLIAGPVTSLYVDNGNGSPSSNISRPITIRRRTGAEELWGLDTGWVANFGPLTQRIVLAQDSHIDGVAMKCDGNNNDSEALHKLILQISRTGGGTLKLPVGVCKLDGTTELQSGVIIEGSGRDSTVLKFSEHSAIYGHDLDRLAIRNLTLENIGGNIQAPQIKNSSRVILQNINVYLNGSKQEFFTSNRNFIIQNCLFKQPFNEYHNGPLVLAENAGFVMRNNTIIYSQGAISLDEIHDADIDGNHIQRIVYDETKQNRGDDVVHGFGLNFAHHLAIRNNTFDLINGPVRSKYRNDGEALLTEGGAAHRTEGVGVVASATTDALVDTTHRQAIATNNGRSISESYGVAIISGNATGQTRRIIGVSDGQIQVEPQWDLIPEKGSHFATFKWGLQYALIRGNVFRDIPRSIWLYQTAVSDVDVVENKIHNSGGIYLRSVQILNSSHFTPMYDVRINGNILENTNSEWASYINLTFVRADIVDFGPAMFNMEIKGNEIQANKPNLHMPQEEAGFQEGYVVRMHAEGPDQSRALNQNRIIGTVLQNNTCINCETPYTIRQGTNSTMLYGNVSDVAN